ncbi:hypothetical protein M413DRAFT_316136 [Hebeloma cylindrosporum]|uniref:RRM domain-containing protein n=1 Tax=Hebeloma cylindrosporum TaxID=76867 RepID=A0A0C3CRE7_HEBCY|nr:hypothetical protein M413DRAFT_316136 [Hebeloma cylindrosporum h7]
MPAAIHHDEDFINKSLLASLDAQADAEPNNYRSSFRPRQFYQPDSYYPQFDYQDQYKHFPVQLSSQTPYGPHVPAGIPPPPAPPIPSANTGPASSSTTTTTGEEISTIFVVGFPEDMSEREFQNMFTFSPGFEAATLKIPNKEYTAYNGLLPSSSNPSAQHQRAYPTDPYSVVLDAGRDGLASWPAAQHDDLAAHHYNLSTGLPNPTPALATSSNTLNLPQRKQIIGFAKFRTREEALSARDVLQGRRVDIEKGAVLKAEMAKKNLHTKRGVGPVPGSLPPSAAGGPSNPGMQIQQQHDSSLFGPASDFTPSSLPSSSSVSQQQNSIPALSRLGWRDSVSAPLSVGSSPFAQQQIAESSASHSMLNGLSAATSTTSPAAEDDRKRDSLLTLGGLSTGLQSLSIASSAPTIGSSAHQLQMPLLSGRGARERAAADDDEQQWRRREETLRDIKDKEREKEANLMKLRAMDSVAYDAFHGVIGGGSGSPSASNFPASAAPSAGVIGPAQSATGMSRQSSSSTSLSLSTPLTASTSNTPWTPGSLPTTVPSSENGRKLDEEPAEEEKIELESTAEVNRQRAEDDDYEAPERRDFRDDQEQGELTEGRTTNINANATNPTTTNEIVGPWDRINSAGSYAAVARSSIPTAARTRTGSERSTSPPPSQPSSSFSMGQSLGMNGASSSHQHLGLHQQYSNQYGYRQTPQPLQPSSQGQSQSYQTQYQHLHMHQQQMLQQQQQQRERDAYMHQYQQQQQQQYRSTQSESGESNGEPPSSTNPVGFVGAGAARLGMLNTNTNGNGHGTSPNPNGNGNGILPPPASSSSSSITLSRHQPAFAGNGVGGIGGASGVASAPSSGSTSSSSNNGGNTSPQLPSPTSGGSSGGSSSTTSLTSAISVGGGGTGALRGTVDQNPPVSIYFLLFVFDPFFSKLCRVFISFAFCFFGVSCVDGLEGKNCCLPLCSFFFVLSRSTPCTWEICRRRRLQTGTRPITSRMSSARCSLLALAIASFVSGTRRTDPCVSLSLMTYTSQRRLWPKCLGTLCAGL